MNLERPYPFWLVTCVSVGTIAGYLTDYGAIQGLTTGMIVAVSPLFLLMLALLFMSFWRPILPNCRCGQYNHKGYQYVSPTGDVQAGTRFKCPKCGRVYESSNWCFDEISNDGHTVPFMYYTKWGRWKLTNTERQQSFP
jgi:hypothetical protein